MRSTRTLARVGRAAKRSRQPSGENMRNSLSLERKEEVCERKRKGKSA